jgi:prepilin-type processing-associated H-X9-DG protein
MVTETLPEREPRFGCVGIIAASMAFLMISIVIVPAWWRAYNGSWHPSCQNHLKQISLSLKMYGDESPGGTYPPLAIERGKLMFEPHPVVPDFMPDATVLLCPFEPEYQSIAQFTNSIPNAFRPAIDMRFFVDDWSYLYTGYVLLGDHDVQVFFDHYLQHAGTPGAFGRDIPLPVGPKTFNAEDGTEFTYDALYRLRRDLPPEIAARIPLLIERPGNHEHSDSSEPAANVLYLDGHVEYIPYPGKWPMTERTIGLLLELDALGEPSP